MTHLVQREPSSLNQPDRSGKTGGHGSAGDRPAASWRTFLSILAAYALLYVPFILSARPLNDDMGRAQFGYAGWNVAGRPLADVIYWLINFGFPTTQIYFYNQMLAVGLLAGAAYLLVDLHGLTRTPLIAAVATIPFLGHPYYLENISYTFDAPGMALGAFCAVAAAWLCLRARNWSYVALAALLLLGAMLIYQPDANLFLLLAAYFIAVAILARADGRFPAPLVQPVGKLALRLTVSLASASACYVAYIRLIFTTYADAYAVSRSDFVGIADLPAVVATNMSSYFAYIAQDWIYAPVVPVLALGVIAFGFAAMISEARSGGGGKRGAMIPAILILAGTFALQFGVLLLLREPVLAARTLVAVGVFPGLGALWIGRFVQEHPPIPRRLPAIAIALPLLALDYSLLVVAGSAAAVSRTQGAHESNLAGRIITDIDNLDLPIRRIAILGSAPVSATYANTKVKFPVIEKVIQYPLLKDFWWGHVLLSYYGLIRLEQTPGEPFAKQIASGSAAPLVDRTTYTIFVFDDTVVIRFRKDAEGYILPR